MTTELCEDIMNEVGHFLPIYDYIKYRQVRGNNIDERLNKFADFITELKIDKDKMGEFLERTGGVISGSSLLKYILNDDWKPFDIDIFIPRITDEELDECCELLTFDRRETVPENISASPNRYTHLKGDAANGLDKVIYLIRGNEFENVNVGGEYFLKINLHHNIEVI